MQVRTSKPGKGDKYFIRQASGGYSTCITGKPKDKNCDVLANCVGYACGAFNEEHGFGYEKYHLNCNAENFIERAIASGLSVYTAPMLGGIMVFQKGNTLSSSDGAGHVAVVIEILEKDSKTGAPTKIRTAESGYGSSAFWTTTRTNVNGKWGAGTAYSYRGTIAPEGYTPEPVPTPEPKKSNEEIAKEVIAGKWGNYPERKTRLEEAGYNYSEIQSLVNDMLKPKETPLKIGDKVKIIDKGNGSSMGTSNVAWGIGWTREILNIYEGRPYPYQVGIKHKGTTGFYKAEALQKL